MKKVFIPDSASFPTTADAVVIGGGIVGVATAYWLSKSGLKTVLVEARDGLSTLTTPQSIEGFRTQFTEPAIAGLALPSIAFYEQFADRLGMPDVDINVEQNGYLFVSDDPDMAPRLEEAVQTHHRLGATQSEFLDTAAIRARFPYIGEQMVAGTFCGRDGWLSSHEVTQAFARASDAKFLISTKVVDIETDTDGVCSVLTDRGGISTRHVVNAAGPFAAEVSKMVGVDLPIEAVRRQKIYATPQPEIPQDAPLCIDIGQEVYWRPAHGGAFLAWVDPDEPVTEIPGEEVATDWNFGAVVLDKIIRLTPFWEDIIPRLRARDILPSAGYYMYTPDDQPLIGPVPEIPGYHLNCGYWQGVMLAPEAGRLAASLVTGATRPQDNPLRLSRYQEGNVTKSDSFLRGRN